MRTYISLCHKIWVNGLNFTHPQIFLTDGKLKSFIYAKSSRCIPGIFSHYKVEMCIYIYISIHSFSNKRSLKPIIAT